MAYSRYILVISVSTAGLASSFQLQNVVMNAKQLAEFGLRLRRRREALGLTRSALCAAAKITRTTLRHLESGRQHPSPPTLARLTAALHTTEDALAGKKPIEPDDPRLHYLTDEDLEVAQAFHHAPTRVKQRALGVLQEAGMGRSAVFPPSVVTWAQRLTNLEPGLRQAIATLIEEFETVTEERRHEPVGGDSSTVAGEGTARRRK
jgi:transcriptional regulator with XRE-family HTH domain